jgi:hypothetical protein
VYYQDGWCHFHGGTIKYPEKICDEFVHKNASNIGKNKNNRVII